jgi:hypothetical protein
MAWGDKFWDCRIQRRNPCIVRREIAMALAFPNPSRSYDAARQSVRFSGYDGMFEIAFSVEIDVFHKSGLASHADESHYLAAFDKMRDSILTVAHKAYANGRRPLYVLTSGEFR